MSPAPQGGSSSRSPGFSDQPSLSARIWRKLVGEPRSLGDRTLHHSMSLVPFLAWVGLGADGLSSSSYGPEEAFRALGQHTYLAIVLAVAVAGTVALISAAYCGIIEEFPHGGGGYLVATKLLGDRVGLVSGSALLVDYVLTITISIAAAGDALFSFIPIEWHGWKLTFEVFLIAVMITLNVRGVRESVIVLAPIFMIFLITHILLVLGGIFAHADEIPATSASIVEGFRGGTATIGIGGLLILLVRAYSLGGGTYTGIEAVSNSLAIMREPRVQTGKRTMLYMALSLAFMAFGLLVCYLLWDIGHVRGKTMNAVLIDKLSEGFPGGSAFAIVALVSEGALLVVAAQAGFLGGPRVLANMAVDSWVPRRFSALSDRFVTQNGILLMGGASLAALLYTRGAVSHIVVMYSINVFLTFSLAMLGMSRSWIFHKKGQPRRGRRIALFVTGSVLCFSILGMTVYEKFKEGGWVTLVVTGAVIAVCFLIRGHYRKVATALARLYRDLQDVAPPPPPTPPGGVDPKKQTAVVLVASYSGLGIHTTLNILKSFPGHYKNMIFVSVGVVDAGEFKGEEAIEALRASTEATLKKYVDLANRLGVAAASRMALGSDAVEEVEKLCMRIVREFPRSTFFAGQIVFQRERWWQPFLHNETAFAIQRRLQWEGQTMVILPARVVA